VTDNANEGINIVQKIPHQEDEIANMNDVQQQNNLANEPIHQQDVSLANNEGHEVTMTAQEGWHAADATTDMEGHAEEMIVQGMAQPVHAAADNNDI
jgi:hypothetical protein